MQVKSYSYNIVQVRLGAWTSSLQHARISSGAINAQMFYFHFSMSLACMLGPWSHKKASFRKNLSLFHFPSFLSLSPQLSLRSNPSFLRKWALTEICSLSFYNVDKKWSVHTPFVLLKSCVGKPWLGQVAWRCILRSKKLQLCLASNAKCQRLYRSLVLRHPTLLSLGVTGAKPLYKFQ